jgi:C4-dicarboxylate-specific signal transduction histidine kinase
MQMMFKAIHPGEVPAVEKPLGQAAAGSDFDFGFRVVSGIGTVKHARVVGRHIGQNSERPVLMGALQDVTASKVAEEALNTARAELAHVARVATLSAIQPISGILMNASTCVRMLAAEPPNVAGAAETARRSIRDANRAAEVIKRLRAMFANQAATREKVNLNDAAREVIALSSTELQRSRAVLQTHFAEDLPIVQGDRIQLQQVILNLLLNAADSMANVVDRPRTVSIRTEIHSNSVKVLVRDSGVGIETTMVRRVSSGYGTAARWRSCGRREVNLTTSPASVRHC